MNIYFYRQIPSTQSCSACTVEITRSKRFNTPNLPIVNTASIRLLWVISMMSPGPDERITYPRTLIYIIFGTLDSSQSSHKQL